MHTHLSLGALLLKQRLEIFNESTSPCCNCGCGVFFLSERGKAFSPQCGGSISLPLQALKKTELSVVHYMDLSTFQPTGVQILDFSKSSKVLCPQVGTSGGVPQMSKWTLP